MLPTRPHLRTYDALTGLGTIPGLLETACAADASYVIDGPAHLSARRVRLEAAGFQQRLKDAGVRRGDVVAVQLPNWWQALAVAHAAWALGAVVNPITPIFRSRELATIFGLANPSAVVVPNQFRGVHYGELAVQALESCGHQAAVITVDRRSPVPNHGAGSDLEVTDLDPDDVAMVMFTSGTTGLPKGVLHTHKTLLVESQSIATVFDLSGKRIFMPSPITHITGFLYGVLMPLQTGADVVLLDRWDPEVAHDLVAETDCRITVAATPFLAGMSRVCEERQEPSALEVFVCGGAAIPEHLVRRAEKMMGTGVARTYGSTELPTLCTVPPNESTAARYTTEGPPIGEARARLANRESESFGELEVHGPEMFVGYLDPRDNETAFTPDGWFRTGDLATIDDQNRVAIVGRLKDLIIRGGENISAKEVEDLLSQMPGVEESAVVGLPHPVMGESVCAVLVVDGAPPTLSDVADHLAAADIARQKWPEVLVLAAQLPSTSSGKVQKYLVRDLALEELRAGKAETRS